MTSETSDNSRVTIIESDEQYNFTLDSLTLSDIHDDLSDLSNSFSNLNISGNESLNSNIIMANPAPQAVLNTEQLIAAARNYGEILPRFKGKINTLPSFINKVDQYYDKYGNTRDETLNNYVFCMICSKLIGRANDFISCRSDLATRAALKEALKIKFGDYTDRKLIAQQLKTMHIKIGETLSDFIERVKAIETQLNLKIQEDLSITEDQQRIHHEINDQTALEVLYNSCSSMLQTILDVKAPENVSSATAIIFNYVTKHQDQSGRNSKGPVAQVSRSFNRNFNRGNNYYNNNRMHNTVTRNNNNPFGRREICDGIRRTPFDFRRENSSNTVYTRTKPGSSKQKLSGISDSTIQQVSREEHFPAWRTKQQRKCAD